VNPVEDEDMGKLAYRLWTLNHYARSERAPQYRELPQLIQRGWILVGAGIRDELAKKWGIDQ
jgi:hypothetical protein